MRANFLELILKDCQVKAQKKKNKVSVMCSRPRQNVKFAWLSRCSRATTAKKSTKKRDASAKLLFFANINLLLFCRPRCRRSRRCLSPLTGFVWTESRFVYGNPVFIRRQTRKIYSLRMGLWVTVYGSGKRKIINCSSSEFTLKIKSIFTVSCKHHNASLVMKFYRSLSIR